MVINILNNLFKRKNQTRADPTTMFFINNGSAHDILAAGYKPLNKNEEVQKCAHIIADLVSSMTIMLMANGKDGDIRIKNELSKKIDIYPNKNMTRKNFIYKIVSDMILKSDGNCVVYPKFKGEYIEDLIIWDMDRVRFSCKEEDYSIKYKDTFFSPDEVLHFVLIPDDKYTYKGKGYAGLLKDTVQNLLQANATKTGFLKSKWKPSLIISINSDAEELQDPEKREKILGSYTGTTEAGEPWLIPAGEIDIKTVQPLSLKDLAIQESITLDKKAVAAAFGIPSFMVGVGEFDQDEYNNFIATTIMSIAQNMQQELTRKLLYSPDMYFKFNPKSLMQYKLNEKVDFVKEMVSGGMLNRNEGRNEFDYAPVDNEGMNDYIVLENYVPINMVDKQKKLKGGD